MPRQRVLLAFGIAWTVALLLSWWVYTRTAAPRTRDVVRVVSAAQDLPIGKRIQATDLKLVEFDRTAVPKGAFQKTADVGDRIVSTPLAAGEVLLASKLAAKGGGEGLAGLIEPGFRAVSVQVNESSGVSGFIQPGTRVDVLFTRIFPNGDAATTTILQNVKVLAYGRQTDPSAKPDARESNRITVATLSVSKAEAERLVLAEQRGKVHFALRNGLDDEVAEPSDPLKTSDLGIEDPRKPQPPAPRPVVAPPAAPPVTPPTPKVEQPIAPPAKAESQKTVVRIYRGDKLTEQELK